MKVKMKKSVVKIIKPPKVGKGKPASRVKLEGYDLREVYRTRLHENRAAECQEAVKKYCHCRCGGVLHGKSHKAWKEKEDELFAKFGFLKAEMVLLLIKHFGGKSKA